MGPRAQQVVPNAADGLDAGEVVGEPSEDPGQNEDQELSLLVGGVYLMELRVFGRDDFEDDLTDGHSDFSELEAQEIIEVSPSCFLHQVVARAVAK